MTATDLDQELAELQSAADAYAARHQFIPDLAWPEGVRIAVNFTADFDAMLLRRLLNEPPMQLAKGEFGGRVGIWRLIELFDATASRRRSSRPAASASSTRRRCARPRQERPRDRRPHVGAPGPKEPALERDHLRQDRSPRSNGSPAGGRSARAAGTAPSCCSSTAISTTPHDSADHRPHYEFDEPAAQRPRSTCRSTTPSTTRCSSASPGSAARTAAQRMIDPEQVEEIWWAAFRQQYQQGGYLNICMHPFVSGRALRIAMLDRLIDRMKALPGVWFPTCEQVARHCIDQPSAARRRALSPGDEPCPGRTATRSATRRASPTPTSAGPTATAAASASSSISAPPAGPEGITPPTSRRPRPIRHESGARRAARRARAPRASRRPSRCRRSSPRSIADKMRRLPRDGPRDRRARLQARGRERARPRRGERRGSTRTTEILAKVAGRRPAGWFSLPRQGDKFAGGAISPNTIDLLIEAGYAYFGNGLADDVPHYWVTRLRQPPRDPDAALLLSLRRPVLPAVPRARAPASRTSGLAAAATGGPSSTRNTSAAGTST